jgi:tight adherence protein C
MDLLIIACVIASMSIFLIIAGAAQVQAGGGLEERLSLSLGAGEAPVRLRAERELRRPFSQRVLLPLLKQVGRLTGWLWPANWLKTVQARLLLAGSPGGIGALDFLGLRALVGTLLLGAGMLYAYALSAPLNTTSLLVLGALFGCGLFLPDVWLSRRITQRQTLILNALPDALDMLTITSEAGLSFEGGLQEMVQKWNNELSQEFGRLLRDIGMGQSRREALLGLSERTGVPDVQSFVAALNQAEELGVSMGRVLRAQSDDLRVRRRQRAYEKANQVPVKIMFPLVFLIFPAIFAVLLGPAIPQLMNLGV